MKIHFFLCIILHNGKLYISFLATMMYTVLSRHFSGPFTWIQFMWKVSESQPGFMLPGSCNNRFLSIFFPIKINVRKFFDCSIREKNILFQMKEMVMGKVLVLLEALWSPPVPGTMHTRTHFPPRFVPVPVPVACRTQILSGLWVVHPVGHWNPWGNRAVFAGQRLPQKQVLGGKSLPLRILVWSSLPKSFFPLAFLGLWKS